MSTEFNQIMLDRVTNFGVRVCKIVTNLPRDVSIAVLAKQVVRSSTSIGANYREAQFARTSKEFLSKLQIALQEAEETRHWLMTIQGTGHMSEAESIPLLKECSELIAIQVASVKSTRRRTAT